MSSPLQTIRYPTGETEFRLSDTPPIVGDIFTRNGDNWTVEDVQEGEDGSTIVTLRPGSRPSRPTNSADVPDLLEPL